MTSYAKDGSFAGLNPSYERAITGTSDPTTVSQDPQLQGLVGSDGTYLGAPQYYTQAGLPSTSVVVAMQPSMHRIYEEPAAIPDDPSCAFWSMLFSWICCVGYISCCINWNAPAGSLRRRYCIIGATISAIITVIIIAIFIVGAARGGGRRPN